MRVSVGSGNPVKVAATERALADRGEVRVDPVAVDSGVSEQPTGHAETVEGAVNRAERALAAGDYDLGVGIEGGVARFAGTDGLYLIMWAAVTDGDRTGRGAGPSLRLPGDVADRVDAGEELGPVMDDLLGEDGVARDQGAAGALTDGIVDRESALAHAVAGALGPFVTPHY
ncbi:inosine/xanthosine triphosphatase [Halostella sp. JP-L12]|uniref:inosine/xanthosine triphosphatase n=1 Tax=Halostella TaxID=1843185 RepID=UPI000EF81E04|nr:MULTISPECIES: inosine/xanthosine triphosphatase [Halostella]NHN47498.1 inosine/xanthosine triphosphatase [Halostella sp. JP-L12]